MNRREALKQMAVLAGGTLSLSTIAGFWGGCTAKEGTFVPKTLTAHQNKLVTVFSERIIPETDTPGAEAAGVNRYIDHMLTNWNTDDEREHFIEGLKSVDNRSKKKYGNLFIDLSKQEQIAIMESLEQEAINAPVPISDSNLRPFFTMMKEFTIVGYYTSEIGASEELNLSLIPGYYDACIPYSNVGRAWS